MHWTFLSLCQNLCVCLSHITIFLLYFQSTSASINIIQIIWSIIFVYKASFSKEPLLSAHDPLHMQKVTGMPSHPAVKAEWIDFIDVVVLFTRSPVFNCLPQSDNDILWQFCFRKWFAISMLIGCCQHAYA